MFVFFTENVVVQTSAQMAYGKQIGLQVFGVHEPANSENAPFRFIFGSRDLHRLYFTGTSIGWVYVQYFDIRFRDIDYGRSAKMYRAVIHNT